MDFYFLFDFFLFPFDDYNIPSVFDAIVMQLCIFCVLILRHAGRTFCPWV